MAKVLTSNMGWLKGEFNSQSEAINAFEKELLTKGICKDYSNEGYHPFGVNYECIPNSMSCKLSYTKVDGTMESTIMTWSEDIPW